MERAVLITFLLCTIFVLFTFRPILAQGDPFNWSEPIQVESNDIFISWLENNGGVVKNYQKVYHFKIDSVWLPTDSLISRTQKK
jgi:hypothetical protein